MTRKKLITEREVIDAWQARRHEIRLSAGGVITPAAADLAKAHGIEIVKQVPRADAPFGSQQTNENENKIKIVIGSDHGGFELKEILKEYLAELSYEIEDVGTHNTDSVDYPDFAHLVAQKVSQEHGLRGVIVDGAGIGSAIAANKVPGIRAATCHDVYTARNSREHNHANMLALGSRVLGSDVAKEILKVWLETDIGGGRHKKRVDKIVAIESSYIK